MALIRSAKKALRVAARKKVFNDRRAKTMRDTLREVRLALTAKSKGEALKLLPKAYKALDKAAKRGVIKKNAASRKKARLSAAIKKLP